jgi:hypothetical protein
MLVSSLEERNTVDRELMKAVVQEALAAAAHIMNDGKAIRPRATRELLLTTRRCRPRRNGARKRHLALPHGRPYPYRFKCIKHDHGD